MRLAGSRVSPRSSKSPNCATSFASSAPAWSGAQGGRRGGGAVRLVLQGIGAKRMHENTDGTGLTFEERRTAARSRVGPVMSTRRRIDLSAVHTVHTVHTAHTVKSKEYTARRARGI